MRRAGIWLIWLICLVCLTGCANHVRTDAPMSSFTYQHTRMHSGSIYRWKAYMAETGPEVHLWLLCGEVEYKVPASEADYQALRELIDRYDLWTWAGFDKTDRHVLDGEGFGLEICFADGTWIQASGSNRFPQGYHDATEALRRIFETYMEKGLGE